MVENTLHDRMILRIAITYRLTGVKENIYLKDRAVYFDEIGLNIAFYNMGK